MISFHRKFFSMNPKVSPWHQLASLATAVFCFICRSRMPIRLYCTCGCKTKMWQYLYICMNECVWGGCLFLLDSKQKRNLAWLKKTSSKCAVFSCTRCKSTSTWNCSLHSLCVENHKAGFGLFLYFSNVQKLSLFGKGWSRKYDHLDLYII